MKIREILESRRNPKLNPKTPAYQAIVERLNNTSDKIAGVPNLFVSFTHLEKLGINPRSPLDHQTPLGIYAYPADYVVEEIKKYNGNLSRLPYAGSNSFANIFKVKGNIVNLSEMTADEKNTYYDKLLKIMIDEYDDENLAKSEFEECLRMGDNDPYITKEGGKFYQTVMFCSAYLVDYLSADDRTTWNKLYRRMGIDGCIDTGDCIIHVNEPTQAMFLHIGAIHQVSRHVNKWFPDNVEAAKEKGEKQRQRKNDEARESIEQLIQYDLEPHQIMIWYNAFKHRTKQKFKKLVDEKLASSNDAKVTNILRRISNTIKEHEKSTKKENQ